LWHARLHCDNENKNRFHEQLAGGSFCPTSIATTGMSGRHYSRFVVCGKKIQSQEKIQKPAKVPSGRDASLTTRIFTKYA